MNHSPPTYPDEFELFNSASPEYQTIFWKNPNLARELSEISKKAKILWEASGCTAAISAQQTPIVTIVSNSYVSAENPNKTYLAHFYFTFSIAKILARSSRLTKNRSQDEIHTSLLNLLNKLYEIIRQHFFHVETNRFHPFLNACRKNTIIEFLLNELREELFKRKDNDFIKTSNREKKK